MSDNTNPNALVYNQHRTAYPPHIRRKGWVELSHWGRVVFRDDPDGHPECPYDHDCGP